MTKIEKMFWEERQQAVAEAEAKGKAEAIVKMIEQAARGASLTVEEACRRFGLSLKEYNDARSYLIFHAGRL